MNANPRAAIMQSPITLSILLNWPLSINRTDSAFEDSSTTPTTINVTKTGKGTSRNEDKPKTSTFKPLVHVKALIHGKNCQRNLYASKGATARAPPKNVNRIDFLETFCFLIKILPQTITGIRDNKPDKAKMLYFESSVSIFSRVNFRLHIGLL